MPRTDFESRFEQALVDGRLAVPGDAVLLGISGGADSTTMLHLFAALARRDDWNLRLHVVHVNHLLRGRDAEQDAAFVAETCRSLEVPCTVESVDVARLAEAEGESVEEVGRRCRFEIYERMCVETDSRLVALGHHADDNAETILHRILRGTGLRGLTGIRPSRPLRPDGEIRIIRPMLHFRRAEILEYVDERGIAYRDDASNASSAHTRNRIRNDLLPLLREWFNPQVEEALIRLADQAGGVQAYLAETGERMLDALVVEWDDRQLVLHCPPLVRKPRVIQTELIQRAILRMGFAEGNLTYEHLNAVADLAAGSEGSKTLHLPDGLRVCRRYSRLVFERAGAAPAGGRQPPEIRVATEGETSLAMFGVFIVADRLPADASSIAAHLGRGEDRGTYRFEEWLDADAVHPPLIARSRRPGDRFQPFGMTDFKKVSDFLIDEKVDAARRDHVVLLCDQLGPIWVVPLRIDDRVRLTRATKNILRLTVRPADPRMWPAD